MISHITFRFSLKTFPNSTLTRFWGVEEEKYGKLSRGGFNGQITTNVYQRIQAGSSKAF
jgi:hypothetical protein